jgi:hypothetical protein
MSLDFNKNNLDELLMAYRHVSSSGLSHSSLKEHIQNTEIHITEEEKKKLQDIDKMLKPIVVSGGSFNDINIGNYYTKGEVESLIGSISFEESDPIFNLSAAKNITSDDITSWNNKLSSYTETDPIAMSYLNQSVKTTASPTFNTVTASNILKVGTTSKVWGSNEYAISVYGSLSSTTPDMVYIPTSNNWPPNSSGGAKMILGWPNTKGAQFDLGSYVAIGSRVSDYSLLFTTKSAYNSFAIRLVLTGNIAQATADWQDTHITTTGNITANNITATSFGAVSASSITATGNITTTATGSFGYVTASSIEASNTGNYLWGDWVYGNRILADSTIDYTGDDGVSDLWVAGQANINGIIIKGKKSAAPTSPVEGWLYHNSTDHHTYIYNGSAWKQLDNV